MKQVSKYVKNIIYIYMYIVTENILFVVYQNPNLNHNTSVENSLLQRQNDEYRMRRMCYYALCIY